jgi:hypothetical protein
LNCRQAIATIPGNYKLNSSGSGDPGEKRSNAFIIVDQHDWCRTRGHKPTLKRTNCQADVIRRPLTVLLPVRAKVFDALFTITD